MPSTRPAPEAPGHAAVPPRGGPLVPARILGTGAAFGARRISTESLVAQVWPGREPADAARRVGIRARHWEAGEGAAGLAEAAVRAALDAAGLPPQALRRIVLATSTGGDTLIPATAHAVAGALGIDGACDCFDLNNSCVGFLSAMDVAALTVAAGRGPVAVVAVEVFSRHIDPSRPRPYLVLGDAAGACVLGAARPGEGFLASEHRTHAALRGRLVTPRPSAGSVPVIDFEPHASEMTACAIDGMRVCTERALASAGISLEDVNWVLPHQPNGHILTAVRDALAIDPTRLVPIVEERGSLGAASTAVSLDVLWRSGKVRPGDRVLLTGVGSGTAAAALIYRVGVGE
jgi:3-oxoacyl-(acyl-carrier-protein) synthase III